MRKITVEAATATRAGIKSGNIVDYYAVSLTIGHSLHRSQILGDF
jgi:hypothetical protein